MNVVEQTRAKGSACSGDFKFLVIIRRVSTLWNRSSKFLTTMGSMLDKFMWALLVECIFLSGLSHSGQGKCFVVNYDFSFSNFFVSPILLHS